MKITILEDDPKSWFIPYGEELARILKEGGHEVAVVSRADEIPEGDCVFFLSCEEIIPAPIRKRNTHNLVAHASYLPQGKGWSPLTWQILEGKNDIPLTLFEAADKVDAGQVYATSVVRFEGHELIDELRQKLGRAIIDLAAQFIRAYPPKAPTEQKGEETFYTRRTPADSEVDPTHSIVELFEHFRVADNDRYPIFFKHRGHIYVLKIEKKKD